MEREREKKERLYWDLQLQNIENVNILYEMDKPSIMDPHLLGCLHQSTDPNAFKKPHTSGTGSLHSSSTGADSLQTERLVGGNELYASVRDVRRLKKAARQCWIRLASEGVRTILPSSWQGQSPRVKGQAWGCVSLSDVLLLVDVKYDVMTHMLYSEMLQEHHTQSVWETMLPWQQLKEEEGLEDFAEEALESGDMLRLAELPGAFRIYRACVGASIGSCREQSWSAVSFLYELHTSRQQERDKLTVLGERLDGESLKLLCLHIRLATLRAQREKLSYRALLAARQSWETWPHVSSPRRAERASLWLRGGEEEQSEDLISASPQQAVLQLLVLTQEQERRHLVKLVHGVSLEDLQGPGCTVPPKEDRHTVLRNGCIKMLSQLHASLQIHNESQTPLEQTNSEPQLRPQPQIRAHAYGKPAAWSQQQLEDCALLLLSRLLVLQEVQASALLPMLKDTSAQHLRVLRDEYESELQTRGNTNLLQLLISEAPFTSGSVLIPKSSNEEKKAETQNMGAGPNEVLAVVSVRRADRELSEVQAADVTNRPQDVCTDCEAVVEEMPYLEILCVSNATSQTQRSLDAEAGSQEEEGGNATKSALTYKKQDSLITFAWSKPPEDDNGGEAEAADGGTGQSPDSESSLMTQVQASGSSSTTEFTQCSEETSGESHDEEMKPTLLQSGSTGHHDMESAEKQCSTEGQPVQPHLSVDPPHSDDPCSGLSSESAGVDVEVRPTATGSESWELKGPEPTHTEDQKHISQTTSNGGLPEGEAMRESKLMDRERVREPVSALEREKTIRNLMDMQRKVEQRQQRDRERQLLRVQERLSIIQSRKAEEDLLGLKHTDRLRHLTQDLPQEDKQQQKTVVRERLEQLRRERSYVLQSKRDRNTAGFKELLGPVALHNTETEDGTD
ncbi:uncharacterized protein LOC118314885 [Scophthalmus maximus]|uniref:uncharacterized protein LOC118314885 n=1 Tax=Scophthalmus maximus TaxID=52904 RepID=UPI001FA8C37A|nr:uncharacterized protein LOC118314885 [Scophthalmus maximus]